MHDEISPTSIEDAQRAWAERALFTLRDLLPTMNALFSEREWSEEHRDVLLSILGATARTSESVILLCVYGQLWDADILTRSVLEGTLKFAYLLQSPSTVFERMQEYSEELFHVALVKDHQKVKDLLSVLADSDAPEWHPLRQRLLGEDELAAFKERFDKSKRHDMERRWGFTGLIGSLSNSKDPAFKGFGGFAHSYSLASHVQHVDMIGASLPLDRERRNPARRDSMTLAHTARLMSEVLTFLYLRLLVAYRFVGADLEPVVEAKRKINVACEGFEGVHADWRSVEYGEDIVPE